MADNVMFNVGPDFDLAVFAQRLADTYRAKGYTVNVADMNNMSVISFDKGTGGINTVLGMGEAIKANCTLSNGTLMINFTDAEWTGKIVGFVVGWFLCLIPFITAIIGTLNQLKLPKNIGSDATMIAASFNNQQY